jgi:hypothetical protein
MLARRSRNSLMSPQTPTAPMCCGRWLCAISRLVSLSTKWPLCIWTNRFLPASDSLTRSSRESALLDERLERRHADPSSHLAVLTVRRTPVMRYLTRERIAQNGAVTYRMLDDPVNAIRMNARRRLVLSAIWRGSIPLPSRSHTKMANWPLPLFNSKNQITVAPPHFGGWLKKIDKGIPRHVKFGVLAARPL